MLVWSRAALVEFGVTRAVDRMWSDYFKSFAEIYHEIVSWFHFNNSFFIWLRCQYIIINTLMSAVNLVWLSPYISSRRQNSSTMSCWFCVCRVPTSLSGAVVAKNRTKGIFPESSDTLDSEVIFNFKENLVPKCRFHYGSLKISLQ